MPTPPWADAPRLKFLKENLSGYTAAQERKGTSPFLANLHERYFARFPEPDEKLMSKEKTRVSAYMNNHSGSRGQKLDGATSKATRITIRDLLRGTVDKKKRQKLQPAQAYSALYYKSKWKAVIQEEWKLKLESEPHLTKADALAYRNVRMKKWFDDESIDVKAEVEHYRNATPEDDSSSLLEGEELLDEKEQSRRIAARERQLAIENVEAVMSEIVQEIEIITGLKSQFLVAGPEPKRGGRMVMFTIATGRTVAGNQSFKAHHPYFQTQVHDKFLAFAKGCYTREDREENANVPFPDCEYPSNISSSNLPSVVPSVTKKPAARKRSRKHVSAAPEALSNSDSIGDSVDPKDSMLDSAEYTVADEEDEDDMDIFSPTLSPDRLIVDSKDSGDGLTLYKTANGDWLSEIELQRLANMARNSRLLMELGLEDAKRNLTLRGRADEEKEPEAEGDREFSVTRARTSLPPRIRHARASKKDITYVDRRIDDDLDTDADSISVVPALTPVTGDVVTGATDATVTVTTCTHAALGSASGGVTADEPVIDNLKLINTSVPDNVPETTVQPTVPSQVSPTPSPLFNNVLSVQVNDHASLPTPTEVGFTSSPMKTVLHDTSESNASHDTSSDASLATPAQPVGLDSVDFSKMPAWMCPPLKHFQKYFRGELEDKVLGTFVALEMAWQPYDKRIGTDGRPPAVTWWIKNARPIDKVPPSVDLESFPSQVRHWWSTLQPQWRVPIVEDWPLSRHIPNGERWQEARLGGNNGLFLVLMCLYWWRRSADEEEDDVSLSEYQSVAEDVLFVLDAVFHSGVSQETQPLLTGSARANARTNLKRKATTDVAEEAVVGTRTLRSSREKENIKPSRAQRARV